MNYDFTGSDSYAADCERGRAMAVEFLAVAPPIRLPHVVAQMEVPLTGVANGFLTLIAERAMASASENAEQGPPVEVRPPQPGDKVQLKGDSRIWYIETINSDDNTACIATHPDGMRELTNVNLSEVRVTPKDKLTFSELGAKLAGRD